MIRFLIKGLIRDKSRSRLPVIVVTLGVMLTVAMHAYVKGFMGETLEMNATFSYGHVKVMTRAYAEEAELLPNDLALLEVSTLNEELSERFPAMEWAPRIRFGGLIDVPDEQGETRAQGPAVGLALDLLSEDSNEIQRLGLPRALIRGGLPKERGEALISEAFSQRLLIEPGDDITLIGVSMNGSMVMHNFRVAGTLLFGMDILDRGTLILDIEDARLALDMPDAAGEIVGFLPGGFYDDATARHTADAFNAAYQSDPDEFAPLMKALSQQGSMGPYVQFGQVWAGYISLVFVVAMALVLWNAGLLGGLRRYGEIGVRLAMGEEKGHVYRTMIYESVCIGIAGSVIGTALGLFVAWLLQEYGINVEGLMEGASLMFPTTIRARITPPAYYIGFIPGLAATVIGTALSGIGIFRRQTSQLFKELEA
ncbi:FtsX-like permease family protein [Candidatus Fermentibacteria bacterium]|nr:FtsX-like permease family protein [Candidatus Fermentibacteria bacterium]